MTGKCGDLRIPDETESNSSSNCSLDLSRVEVSDELNVNRWLMRIMRLGSSFISSSPNHYQRRKSAVELSGVRGHPNALTHRNRRFSDSISSPLGFHHGNIQGQYHSSSSQAGSTHNNNLSKFYTTSSRSRRGSMEQTNLLRMRNSNLGQSAPSLSASLVSHYLIKYFSSAPITKYNRSVLTL
nr:uncharacterized protein LOC121123462 [Lepeophtheirus salmonis]